ncbi:hypothetical protein BY458DRAFT_531135 [Sporodiniella umbellata]|nr:hypothetical protein BY458DRAFT_531135 [Sporodiniella umbellata]
MSSTESWILMSLVHRDLDDKDYNNALLLSERLFAIDNRNSYFRFLYAVCLFESSDYFASYMLLQHDKSVFCLSLFSKSCLQYSRTSIDDDIKDRVVNEGIFAIKSALEKTLHDNTSWTSELTSVQKRQHTPSRSSLYHLLGDLYVQKDNINAATEAYKQCLELNPYKISAYLKLCDIAPDTAAFESEASADEFFKDLPSDILDILPSTKSHLPPLPDSGRSDISFKEKKTDGEYDRPMPDFRETFHDVSLVELKDMVADHPNFSYEDILEETNERGLIERHKDTLIEEFQADIQREIKDQKTRNKHGLHKAPPDEMLENNDIKLPHIDLNRVFADQDNSQDTANTFIHQRKRSLETDDTTLFMKRSKKTQVEHKNEVFCQIFLPMSLNNESVSKDTNLKIIDAMNKIVKLLRIMAKGYFYKSSYYGEKAIVELKQLDARQYETAWILSILGKAYYDTSDYEPARLFFKRSFYIAPWYCEYIPYYSTCLWYLQKESELNVLAYLMKHNPCHLYEAYIVAGNWAKCVKDPGNDATYWFKKAANIQPGEFYVHALLGYEDSERENYLGAKMHFTKSMNSNRRSYIGWFGLASTYRAADKIKESIVLLREAVRLHPRHPVVLATLAEGLYKQGCYEEAKNYIDICIKIAAREEYIETRQKIMENLEE